MRTLGVEGGGLTHNGEVVDSWHFRSAFSARDYVCGGPSQKSGPSPMVCDWRNIAGCFDLNTCISSMGRVRPSQEAGLPSSVAIGHAE